MSLTREDVSKIANLARLALTDEELDHYGAQLSAVLDYAARLNEVRIDDDPRSGIAGRGSLERRNVMRDDVIMPSLPTEDAPFNAAAVADSQFLIQSVLDE